MIVDYKKNITYINRCMINQNLYKRLVNVKIDERAE
jgi:hypothetical protein